MEKLRNSSIDDDIMLLLQNNVTSYLEQLDNYESQILDSKQPKLVFDSDNSEKILKR